MRRAATTLIAWLTLIVAPRPAIAQSGKGDAPTILPWTTGAFQITPEERRLAVAFQHLFPESGARLSFQFSAPLDSDSRMAALVSSGQLAKGFRFSGNLTLLDSTYQSLERTAVDTDEEQSICRLQPPPDGKPCTRKYIDDLLKQQLKQADPAVTTLDRTVVDNLEGRICREGVGAGAAAPSVCGHREMAAWMAANPSASLAVTYRILTKALDTAAARMRAEQEAKTDLARHIVPRDGKTYYTLGADAIGEYDRKSVYVDDIATKPVSFSSYSARVNGVGTIYAFGNSAFTLRIGGSWGSEAKLKKFERCEMVSTGSMSISGKSCDSEAVFYKGKLPDATFDLSAMATWTIVLGRSGNVTPGFELRAGAEQLRTEPALGFRVAFFISPAVGPTIARLGIALDWSYYLTTPEDMSHRSGDLRSVTPIAFIGVSP